MTTAVHQLDDGAWISVNDSREVNVSNLWLLAESDVCDCELTDFLAEGFVDVGVDHLNVEAKVAGQCIACGESGVTDWLAVGRDASHFLEAVLPAQRLDERDAVLDALPGRADRRLLDEPLQRRQVRLEPVPRVLTGGI